MKNLAIFASGEGTNAENLFNYFNNDKRVKIKLVVTNNDAAGIIERAERHKKNVQIISRTALNEYTSQIIEFLNTEKIDIIVLAGFLLKVPEALVKAFPDRIINIHPALLPKFGIPTATHAAKSPRPRQRANRAAHSLMPPFR